MDDIEIRPLAAGEEEAFVRLAEAAFLARPSDEAVAREVAALQPERALVAVDDGRIVATTTSIGTEVTRPGGTTVAMAAVTGVGVLATHRRRGLARALLTEQLAQCRGLGDVVCGLLSSEAPIYGRYGYGVATERQTVEVDAAAFALHPDAARVVVGLSFEMAQIDDAPGDLLDVVDGFWDRHRARVPGEMSRTDAMWRKRLGARPGDRFDVVCRRGDDVVGVASLDASTDWSPSSPVTSVRASVAALDVGARLGLVEFCCGLDLVASVRLHLAVDDLLPWALVDRRAVRVVSRTDWLWLRVIDVAGCLDGRATRGAGHVDLEVLDDTGAVDPSTSGRWRLHGDHGVLRLEQIDAAAPAVDVVRAPVGALGSMALGGVRAEALAALGVVEGSPAAVAHLGDMLGWPTAPVTQTSF